MIDDDFGKWPLPTRDGISTGNANERQMLDRGGMSNDGFRTDIRVNVDGSTTLLRTRGGNPEFTTTRPDEEEIATLYCRMMSDLYPRGAEVVRIGQAYATQNAELVWPTHPTAKGVVGARVAAYRGKRAEPAEDYPDSQGSATWYDTRPKETRQFSDVLSWACVMHDPQASITKEFRLAELQDYFTAEYGAGHEANSFTAPGGGATKQLGESLPGQVLQVGSTRDFRYTEAPDNAVTLYRNGKATPVSGMLLAACLVKVGGETRYRIVRLGSYAYNGTGNLDLVVEEISEVGAVISSYVVTPPAGSAPLLGMDIAPRWNSSGTEAACYVHYDGGETLDGNPIPTRKVLLLTTTNVSSFWTGGPYGSGSRRDDSTQSSSATHTEHVLDYERVDNLLVAIDYVGDDLVMLRKEVTTTTVGSDEKDLVYDNTLVDFWSYVGGLCFNNPVSRVTGSRILGSTALETKYRTRLVMEPEGTVILDVSRTAMNTVSSTEEHSYAPVSNPLPPCGDNVSYSLASFTLSLSGNVTTSGKFVLAILADLRKPAVFVVVTTGSTSDTTSRTGGTTTPGYGQWTQHKEYSATWGLDSYLYTGATETKVLSAPNVGTETFTTDSTSPEYVFSVVQLPALPTYYIYPSYSNAGFFGDDPTPPMYSFGGMMFSAALDKRGKFGVASLLHTQGLELSATPALANFSATTKMLSKDRSGAWRIANLSLPTYDGTVKWIGEPLIL